MARPWRGSTSPRRRYERCVALGCLMRRPRPAPNLKTVHFALVPAPRPRPDSASCRVQSIGAGFVSGLIRRPRPDNGLQTGQESRRPLGNRALAVLWRKRDLQCAHRWRQNDRGSWERAKGNSGNSFLRAASGACLSQRLPRHAGPES